MKKACVCGMVALLALAMISCDFGPDGSINDTIPSVQYSADGTSITLSLEDNGAGGDVSRALTSEMAKRGHDFFEIVFFDGTNVARASWDLGQPTGIKNVPRGGANGIDYGDVDPSAVGPGATPATDPDIGAAILFIGRKADRTLLAVGSLTNVDGAATATTVVTAASKTVTFSVSALTANASTDLTAGTSSFLTDDGAGSGVSAGDTVIIKASHAVDGTTTKDFPLYNILSDNAAITTTLAEYTLGGTSSYADGIRVNSAAEAILRVPRFLVGGKYMGFNNIPDATTTAAITNNATPTSAFVSPIAIAFTTPAKDVGILSFAFKIPVYAVSKATGTGVPDALIWNIQPAFGSNLVDLDDGTNNGGSILIGVGANFAANFVDDSLEFIGGFF